MVKRCTVSIVFASALLGQSTPAGPGFEVASIKATTMTPRDAANAGRLGMRVDNARVEIGAGSLTFLIATAYRVEASRISGPDWMIGQRFDIQANIPEGATREKVPELLQALLAERFKLAVHREQKQQQVYALVVDKGGPKLMDSAPDAGMSDKPFPHGDGGRRVLLLIRGTDGLATVSTWKGLTVFEAEKISLPELARDLMRYVDLPILDMTGLKGTYQVALEVPARAAGGRANGWKSNQSGALSDASDPGGVSIFASVQKLGLRLEKRKAALDYLIVDHVEKTPTEN